MRSESDAWLALPFLAVAALSLMLVTVQTLACTLIVCALFALPGVLLLQPSTGSFARAVVYGAPLGYSLTSLLVVAVVVLRGWDLPAILAAYLLGLAAAAGVHLSRARRVPRPR